MVLPKCTSTRHAEFTCLSAYYQNRKYTRSKWCETCLAFFAEVDEED